MTLGFQDFMWGKTKKRDGLALGGNVLLITSVSQSRLDYRGINTNFQNATINKGTLHKL